ARRASVASQISLRADSSFCAEARGGILRGTSICRRNDNQSLLAAGLHKLPADEGVFGQTRRSLRLRQVLEDRGAFAELEALGIRSVPIVRRGNDWANGQVLREVARIAGIAWGGAPLLPVGELAGRLVEIQIAAQRLFAQIPDEKIGGM